MRSLTILLQDFAAAWNRHDIDALLELVTDDCIFETSSGQHSFGDRYAGKEALRLAFPMIWQRYPDARWDQPTHVICGDRGFSEWTFRGKDVYGNAVEMRGVDLFVFQGGKIARKDTYRKDRLPSE